MEISAERENFILRWWPVLVSIIGAFIVLVSTIAVGATLLYRFNLVEAQQKESKAISEFQYNQIIQRVESVQSSIGIDKIAIEVLKEQVKDNRDELRTLKEKFERGYK